MNPKTSSILIRILLQIAFVAPFAGAQTIDPFYAGSYSLNDLGSVPGVPARYGGLTLQAGSLDTLLIGGTANEAGGGLYSITVTRGAGNHITGFSGVASLIATAPYNDGSFVYAPNGTLLFTQYPINSVGELKPGSVAPDKTVDVSPLGVATSIGSLGFVPAGSPGAGQLKIVSYNASTWYTTSLTPDGSGTYDLTAAHTPVAIGGGPEGFVYVPPASALFPNPSLLISEYDLNDVATYQVDANGDPIVGTRKVLVDGLTGAEGAFIDPLTGDFLFSTFGGGDKIIEVQGFVAPPPAPDQASTMALLFISCTVLFLPIVREQIRGGTV
jgi:hypothetical protein